MKKAKQPPPSPLKGEHEAPGKYKITISTSGEFLKVYILGLVHVAIRQEGTTGVQSWKKAKDWYCIEYYHKDGNMLCEYDDVEKWSAILKLLDEVLY